MVLYLGYVDLALAVISTVIMFATLILIRKSLKSLAKIKLALEKMIYERRTDAR